MEVKMLSDADKLDALRVIGVARIFVFSGVRGRSLEVQMMFDVCEAIL
jgi:uncharacterized protein